MITGVREVLKHRHWDDAMVEENQLNSTETREVVMEITRTVTKVRSLLSVMKYFTAVDKRWFRTYVPDAFGAVKKCYVRKVLSHGHVDLVRVPTNGY